jgi:hypothetical protein
MTKTLCPRCGQDYVALARVKPLNADILICPECDAFWWADETIDKQTFNDFGTFIESKGYRWEWSLLEIAGKISPIRGQPR